MIEKTFPTNACKDLWHISNCSDIRRDHTDVGNDQKYHHEICRDTSLSLPQDSDQTSAGSAGNSISHTDCDNQHRGVNIKRHNRLKPLVAATIV